MKEKELKDILKQELEARDMVVWFAPHFKKLSWDVFGIFDCIALEKDKDFAGKLGRIFFIQITTLTNLSHRRKKIVNFMVDNNCFIPNSFIYAYSPQKKEWRREAIIRGWLSNSAI